MDNIELESEEQILIEVQQCVVCDIPAVVLVLLLPITMIVFANSKNGIFIGSVLLVLMIYGIFTIYKKLFNKQLLITNQRIIFEKKQFNFTNLQEIIIKESLIGKQLDIAEVKFKFINEEIIIYNVKNPHKIKKLLDSLL